ncbi:MAG: alkaline phosphatase family protein [Chromatiales bacterium]|nr:alkaline phosphatase family protein [Chromatiales bacterium]
MPRLFSLLLLVLFTLAHADAAEKPRLVLLLTVDQLRGDMPQRLHERFGKSGFRYLMEHGLDYTNANYLHSTTFTAVGHATLATGGNPPEHGLAGNDWADPLTGERVYCVEDGHHQLLGAKTKPHSGTSPRNLTASTFGDELVMASAGRSRVFSVSTKDRGAILPGGHLGKAFWYHGGSGRYISSTYYYDELPAWVQHWNGKALADNYRGKIWDLLRPRHEYVFGEFDQRPEEQDKDGLGRSFPHTLDTVEPKDFYKRLRFTPMSDELLVDFAKTLLREEKLGQGKFTDVLAISLSATDFIGHVFGPDSLEYEDNQLRLDRQLAALLAAVDKQVGLKNTLVILTGDHGSAPIPEAQKKRGFHAGRVDTKAFLEAANRAVKQRFNIGADLVTEFWNPSIYLDLVGIRRLGLDLYEVEKTVADAVSEVEGIDYALPRTELLKGAQAGDPIVARLHRSFHPKRSGNVLIGQGSYWFLHAKPSKYAATHGSPHNYDTHVPLMIAGPGIGAKTISRPVAPESIAATITTILGVQAPSGSVGAPLTEAVGY